MRTHQLLFMFCLTLAFAGFSSAQEFAKPSATSLLTITQSTPQFLRVSADIPDEVFEQAQSTDETAIPSFSTITQPGKPEIPFISRSFLIPPTGGVRLADVQTDSHIGRSLRPVSPTFDENSFVQTDLQADDEGFWPSEKMIIGEPAILRGYRIVTVTMFPEQVNLNTGEVRRNESFDFSLEFAGDEVNPVMDPYKARPSQFVPKILKNLVENPPPSRDNVLSGSYLYVIPDHQQALEEMEPLLEWRRQQGHKVTVAVVENNAAQEAILEIIRNAYQSDLPVEFVTLVGDASRGDFNVPAYSQNGDWGYSLQEGQDALPDLAIGRLSCRNASQLAIIVNKLVTYEKDPFDDNESWFLQGGVVAGASINGISEVFVAKYVRRELYRIGFTEVRGFFWPVDGDARGNQPFLTDWFRWGISVLHYRAFHNMNNLEPQVIDNLPVVNGRWPAVLAISCETGNFTGVTDGYSEHFLRARGGGIGAIGTATPNTNVKYNNLMAGGVWKGIYRDGQFAFGWGLNSGKFELWRAFSGLDNNYLSFMEWNNLMGDAGTHVWTGLPSRIEVEHPESIAIGQSAFSVTVRDTGEGNPVEGALVCLYKGEELHEIGYTNVDGVAELILDPEALTEGEMLVTVTKHNVRPYLGSADVERKELFLGVEDWRIEGDDDDGWLIPGDSATLFFQLSNSGSERPEGRIGFTLRSRTPWLSIEADTVFIDEAPEPGASVEVEHIVEVDSSCYDGTVLPIAITIIGGDDSWTSVIEPVCSAPLITVESYQIEDGSIDPGEVRNISFLLGNFGTRPSESFTAILISNSRDLTVLQDQAGYIGLDVGDTDWERAQPFRISTNDNITPGTQFSLQLVIIFDDNTSTTASTILTVGRPGQRDPFGPDAYGYICFDSYDTSWAMAPDYDWIEIDPNAQRPDFQGQRLAITDVGDNRDTSIAVNLPFEFRYYGEDFDLITICSNGWAAFGDQSDLADFRNTHIGQALGPSAQLCAWWDNLMTPEGSGIFTYFDEEGGRFIIEWSNLARLLENNRQGATETFQIILYSQNYLPTPSGDGVITFQYNNVTNQNQPAHNDIPFCTIGIGNLDDTGGLEYTYWSQYSAGAREIRNGMAITFSPTIDVLTGVVRGRVSDAETNRPIEGVTVRSNRRGIAVTDGLGNYILSLAAGGGYSLTAGKPGWNDSTRTGIEVQYNDSVTFDFALFHPEFSITADELERTLDIGDSESIELNISNTGNGALQWDAVKHVEGEGGAIGGRRFNFPAAQRAGDTGLVGVAHIGDRFYVSGSNGGRGPRIYVFDERGALINSFAQPGVYINPIPDLAWDGELLWGTGGRNVYGFDLEGNIQRQFIGPYAENVGIAWDPVRALLWISGAQHNNGVYGCNRQGGVFATLSTRAFRVRGLGFWQNDPDDYPLYVLHSVMDSLQQERSIIHKYSLAGRSDTMLVRELIPDEPERPGGIEVTSDFSAYDWSLVVLQDDPQNNHGGDRIDVYQLGIVTNWLGVHPASGVIEADNSGQFFIDLNSAGLDSGTVFGEVTLSHNSVEEQLIIPVTLHVRGLNASINDPKTLPGEVALTAVYPSPFNSSFRIAYDIPQAGNVDIAVFDLQGRIISAPVTGHKTAGSYELTLDASKWSSGVYAVQLRANGVSKSMKVICIK